MPDEDPQKLGTDQEPTVRKVAADKKKEDAAKASAAHKALKAAYKKLAKDPTFAEFLEKVKSFANYHVQLAKDGVGYEQYKGPGGDIQQKTVRFTPDERTGHLDKAAGIEEILNYVDRLVS